MWIWNPLHPYFFVVTATVFCLLMFLVMPCVNCSHYLCYRAQDIFRDGLDSPRLRMTVERSLESSATTHTPQASATSGEFDFFMLFVFRLWLCHRCNDAGNMFSCCPCACALVCPSLHVSKNL